ncbi:MAG: DUF3307 domain-containing protein, partial [bacterium]|nr:DUF3307 domain-containing protein [bacterium]
VEIPFVLKCLLLVTCHMIGDFVFQGDWIAAGKGKSWEILTYHVLIYTAVFVPLAFLVPEMSLATVLIIFGTHFLIDPCKARWKILKTIWQDQLCHFTVLGGLLAVGWL